MSRSNSDSSAHSADRSTSSAAVASLASALRNLYDEHRRIRLRFASRLGLTPTEFSAVLILAEQGDLPSKQLASELGITPSAVTAMAGRLEDAGFVTREMHPTDRRSVVVTLVGSEGRPRTWVYDEYLAAVEEAVADFAPLRSPEVTDALEQTAIAMRSVGN